MDIKLCKQVDEEVFWKKTNYMGFKFNLKSFIYFYWKSKYENENKKRSNGFDVCTWT